VTTETYHLRNCKLDKHQTTGVKLLYRSNKDNKAVESKEELKQRVTRLYVWDMGTGKTMFAVAAVSHWCLHLKHSEPCIVVVPSSTMYATWKFHFDRYSNLNVHYITTGKELDTWIEHRAGHVVVITHGLVGTAFRKGWVWDKEGEEYEDVYGNTRRRGCYMRENGSPLLDAPPNTYGIVIIDEAQVACNVERKVQIGNALHRLCRGAIKTAGLTGTPILNKPSDMAGILFALDARSKLANLNVDYFSSMENFQKVDPKMVQYNCKVFVNRVKESDMTYVLPALTHRTVFVDNILSGKDKQFYNSTLLAIKKIWIRTEQRMTQNKENFMIALKQLSSLVLHPKLNDEEEALKHPSAKMNAAMNQVHVMLTKHEKVVVTANSLMFLNLIRKALLQSEIAELFGHDDVYGEMLDGSTSPMERSNIVTRFLSRTGPRLLFLSMHAGGVGLNITPGCTGMLVLDLWFSPALHRQVEKRIHRRGQTEPVEIVTLIGRGTIENALLSIHLDKDKLASLMVDDCEHITAQDATWKLTRSILGNCNVLP